jgi:gluconolactonase
MIRALSFAMLGLAIGHFPLPAADPTPIDLWPGKVPGETGNVPPEKDTGTPNVKSITNVSLPTISLYRPAKAADTGTAIVIAPGGGYNNLAWEHEGTMVGEWLQSIGVTGVLLKYRVPRRPDRPRNEPPLGALQDAQRAISLTRSKAKDWGLNPNRIGMLGFSAGGHLTAWTMTNFDKRSYEAVDAADKASCRPDFAVLVYPGGVVDRQNRDNLAPEIRITKQTPRCFLAVAYNDAGPFDGSMKILTALKKAGVPAEMHVYAEGGHGFGMRTGELPHTTWPKRCEEWMKVEGLLNPNPVAPGATLQKLSGEFAFTEGPTVDADGNIYFTDQPNDRIMKWSTDGKLSTFMEKCGRSNGLCFDAKGILWACADEKNELWKIDVATKKHAVVAKGFNGKLFNGPNDVWVRPDGGAYFTDPFYKRDYWKRGPEEQDKRGVYYLSPKGELTRVDADCKQPNGIVGTPDGKKLYVADIDGNKTYSYDIQKDGALKNRTLFCPVGSDGMTLDADGNVYLTGRGVIVFDKNGAELTRIPVAEVWTANVCFGGKDMQTLFITASKSLYSIRMRVKGASRE